MTETVSYLAAPPHLTEDNEKIAYKMSPGTKLAGPTIIWCGGLKSDMDGTKAVHLHEWAENHGYRFIRFDYYGHGQSSGKFRDGIVSRWGQDIVTVMDALANQHVILIGSSMGGWASLLAAKAKRKRVKALMLIAPAPDFTEKLMWKNWPDEVKETIMSEGIYYAPSGYDEPYEYSLELVEDGRAHQLLDEPFAFSGPVRIFQGGQDEVVPWQYSQQLVELLTSLDVTYTLIKDADHSVSRPQDLTLLTQALSDLCQTIQP